MIDYHTHILPKMDDGSGSLRESRMLLEEERAFGIDSVVLTPHFYANQNSPRRFLERREGAWNRLQDALGPDVPQAVLGAEVQYFPGICQCDELESLTISGTRFLLLEMPFQRWDNQVLQDVYFLAQSGELRIVLAHVDRYYSDQPHEIWQELFDAGIFMQLNASAFHGFGQRRRYLQFLRNGWVQMLGSDCHNMAARRPNWDLVPKEAPGLALENLKKAIQRFDRL